MSERMKGFTCCGDCIHYNYKKHKCNLGVSVVIDARNPFYDDCPIPDITSEQEIRNKAIEEFAEEIKSTLPIAVHRDCSEVDYEVDYALYSLRHRIDRIAEQLKGEAI